ncbi:uncharacterized protein LOC113506846 [Trichoplusia ni]|uniref:Uncharacterized protein LOC113506846 n=1 Tax=Trichoplusia ni TaxID=7111 RepID=A0A7E5WXB8_TRINI|nr:uncharacterized protein LOC113506846 [Trichoplusia ni]
MNTDASAEGYGAILIQRANNVPHVVEYFSRRTSEVESLFLAAASTYKNVEKLNDSDALQGLPLILRDEAAEWWQGAKTGVENREKFCDILRHTFAPRKPAYMICHQITHGAQQPDVTTEAFIAKKRALFASLPPPALTETQQIVLVFALNCTTCKKSSPIKKEDLRFCAIDVQLEADSRPVVFVEIDGIKGTAYIDTCAKMSVASYSLYVTLAERGCKFEEQPVNLTLADGVKKSQRVLKCRAEVDLLGHKVQTTFIVLPEAKENRLYRLSLIQCDNCTRPIPHTED